MKKTNSIGVNGANADQDAGGGITDRAAFVFRGEYMAASAVCDRFGSELSAPAVAEIARVAQARLTGEVADMAEEWGLPPVACRAGCAWCCSALNVSAWPLEIFAIADWLREHRSQEQLGATMDRLRAALAEESRQRTVSPRHPPRVCCAFLEGGKCSVYSVRPASCVGWTSTDAAPCEAWAGGDETAKSRVNAVRMATARAVPLGAATALMHRGGPGFERDGSGPGGFVDLSAGVLAVLERGPEALAQWLAGEMVLGAAPRPTQVE